MKFVINTTWSRGDKPPCEGAEKFKYYQNVRRRIFDENGKPIILDRDVPCKCWTIEINSLEELMKLTDSIADKCDDGMFEGLIMLPTRHYTGLPQIEIYDTYRE